MSETKLSEQMRKIALDLPAPDDMTNREYWLRTEILEWADKVETFEAREKRRQAEALSSSLRAMGL